MLIRCSALRHTGRRVAAALAVLVVLVPVVAAALPTIEALPGAAAPGAELAARLEAALAEKGAGYRPRTRHLRADGSPRYTNRLIFESSPYLLQHAHNPVDWYPWGDEAFARAAKEGKPVLLSIGYSTCHWCHVMEEESFEDEEIARYLNENYIAIKVDRELRPDVDETYMHAVQLLTGGGGWPMTVWLTPTREPFSGGTYFPPARFLDLLRRLRAIFDAEPLKVAGQAAAITDRVRRLTELPAGDSVPGAALLHKAYEGYQETFDHEHGGFGGAPKFPAPPELDFLLRYARHAERPEARDMVARTLEQMAAGGIHDQVGGGFHRYATDSAWQVPHFEKMLYDNAELALVYLAAWQATGRADFAAVVRDVLDYLAREMTAPGGGFYSATDADSDGEEGKFFVWTPAEVRAVLDPPHAEAALAYYGVTAAGNFHGKSVLHVAGPRDALVDEARPRLYAARQHRPAPHRDDKILAGWNGLAIAAFARAGAALGVPEYVAGARAAARFVLLRMRTDGRLRRAWAGGAARGDACLDDYAYLASGLLDLYEATFDLRWLDAALGLVRVLDRDFRDAERGGFFLTAADGDAPLGREKPFTDGALPSGNAVAALTLLRLAELTGDQALRERADDVLRAFAPRLEGSPAAAPALLSALDFRLDRAKEVVIVRPTGAPDAGGPLLATVRAAWVPNEVLTAVVEGPDLARQRKLVPLVAEKQALRDEPTAYVCEQRVCALPTTDAAELGRQLATVARLASP